TITKATAVITVTGFSGVYDGAAHGVVSSSAKGVNNEDLTGLVIANTTYTNVPGGLVHWTFTNENYGDQDGDATVTITKANATINVTHYSVTYNGNAHTATGSATGVNDESLSGLDLSGTTHTNADDYPTDPWTFTDSTGNYNNDSGSVHDHIDKANAHPVV